MVIELHCDSSVSKMGNCWCDNSASKKRAIRTLHLDYINIDHFRNMSLCDDALLSRSLAVC